jgi:polyisoprenoid-binding protein YceI
MRFAAALIIAILTSQTALAAPAQYTLDVTQSQVGFEADFGPDKITGDMPVTRADLILDFDRAANSKVSVALDVSNAKASFPFAAQALKGPKVLDARQFPTITFQSRSVTAEGSGARVVGDVTIRGITRPVTLTASIFRQTGSAPGDLSRLTIRLTGTVRRSQFDAIGWSDMVGDEVRLDVLARVIRTQ